MPWSAKYIACLGDPITDLTEDMAAEQKARTTYEHLIAATCDSLAKDTLRFLVAQKLTFLCDISALDGFRPALSGESRVC